MIGHSFRLHGGNRWRRLAPYDPNMGALALRGAGRDVKVRQQTDGSELPRSIGSVPGAIEQPTAGVG
jgi:hypothetical protein